MTGQVEKLAFILNTASYDRVAFALNVATAAAAVGQEVALLFGYGGVVRLKTGCADTVGDETEAWIREHIKSGIEKDSLHLISELLETLLKLGGRIYACPAAMALHNLTREELLPEVHQVCSLAEFMSRDAQGASAILYV